MRLHKEVVPLRELRRQHVVSQSLDFSCGAAGLSTLLNFFLGDDVTEEEVIIRLLETVPLEKVKERRGFSLFDLKKFAEERGYKVTGYQMSLEFLRDLGVPVMVPVSFRNSNHFVIVRGIVGDRVFIADPAAGNLSLRVEQFEKIWGNGIGLVIEDPDRDNSVSYALSVNEKDLLIGDYAHLGRLFAQTHIRTAIFPSEF